MVLETGTNVPIDVTGEHDGIRFGSHPADQNLYTQPEYAPFLACINKYLPVFKPDLEPEVMLWAIGWVAAGKDLRADKEFSRNILPGYRKTEIVGMASELNQLFLANRPLLEYTRSQVTQGQFKYGGDPGLGITAVKGVPILSVKSFADLQKEAKVDSRLIGLQSELYRVAGIVAVEETSFLLKVRSKRYALTRGIDVNNLEG